MTDDDVTFLQKCVKHIRPDKEPNNSANLSPRITKFCTDIYADLPYSRTGYDVISYFRSAFIEIRKKGRNFRIRRLWVELSGVAFCLPYHLVGFLLAKAPERLLPHGQPAVVRRSSAIVVRCRPSQSELVEYLENRLT